MAPLRAILAFAILGAGQQPTGPIIRTTTRVVEVRVVVHDEKGNLVPGLTRDDFHIFDNGKERPISLFAAEGKRVHAESSEDDSSPRSRNLLKPDDYAIILLDWLNTSLPDRLWVFDEAKQLLQTYKPHQKTAIYSLSDTLRIVHQFTNDTDLLLDALDVEGCDGYAPANQPAGAGPEFGPAGARFLMLDMRIMQTAREFDILIDRLAHVPGHKSLIWISDGFPDTLRIGALRNADYRKPLDKIIGNFNAADIAVYSIFAPGLSRSGSYTSGPDTMSKFAARTGGSMFSGRNDLHTGMREALEDIDTSYTLGFAVPADAKLGLHQIDVRGGNRKWLLRYRESYRIEPSIKQ
jgi:VWFA-related protein